MKTSSSEMTKRSRDGYERTSTLFAALQDFANSADTVDSLRKFRSAHPQFFLPALYDNCEHRAVKGKPTFIFVWKHFLQHIWSGRDIHGDRLRVLLGLAPVQSAHWSGPDFKEVWAEFTEISDDILQEEGRPGLADPALLDATAAPNWRTGKIDFKFQNQFQDALYALMQESWRARACGICGKYIVALKPPQIYCSAECTAEAKRKRNVDWWRTLGHKQYMAKKKSRKKRSRGNNQNYAECTRG